MRGVVTIVAAALLAGCLPSASGEPSPSTSAAPSASAAPTEPAVAVCDASAFAKGDLVLRVEHIGELGRDWLVSVYDDGRILSPGPTAYEYADDAWLLVRRLTNDGVNQLVSKVVDTGLFESSASYQPVLLPGAQPPGHGGSGYTITVLRDSGYVAVDWTSIFPDDDLYYEPSPEREQLDALGAEFLALDQSVPEDAWLPGERCPYEPQMYQVIVAEPQPWGGDPADLPADIADITWPLGGDFLDWGEPFSNPGSDPNTDGRCGTVTRAEAIDLVDGLLAAGAEGPASADALDTGRFVYLRLGDRAEVQLYEISLEGLMPESPGDCSNAQTPASSRI